MNTKKLVIATAVAGALAGASGAQARIEGVPGEALLVPFAAASYGEPTDGTNTSEEIHTAVIITTPWEVGSDTVLNGYTTPNVNLNGDYVAPDDMVVHWYAFDEKSKEITDGSFPMTPNDVYFFSPQDNNLREYIGYLVFADDNEQTRSGEAAATFAMAGNGFMLLEDDCEDLGSSSTGLCGSSDQALALPIVPMSDGADPTTQAQRGSTCTSPGGVQRACNVEDGNAHLGITYENNVVSEEAGYKRGESVGHVSPLVAGVRMQAPFSGNAANGEFGQFDDVLIQGLFSHYDGNWTHVMWFSDNDADRVADPLAYDDDETEVSCRDIPVPNELNIIVYADDDNRVYDMVQGFIYENDDDGDTSFEDACLKSVGNTCRAICGTGSTGFFGWPDDGFTQAAPGIGIMEYRLEAGPYDTSTGLFFQFMSNVDWTDDYNDGDIAVGSDFDIYANGYQEMTELGKF